ncbi:MAG: iron ABC transporter substrate-binding protein [Thermaerobacterales bacterium]
MTGFGRQYKHRIGSAGGTARWILVVAVAGALLAAACGQAAQPAGGAEDSGDGGEADGGSLVIYSGRNENLIGPIIDRFEQETGIRVKIRYGGTSELAGMLLEEGARSPADLFFAQDAGALGAIANEGMFRELPADLLERVEPRFRSPQGNWTGISGRARVVAYNVDRVDPADLPDSIWGFTDPEWRGRIGWPPTNGSFQAFITAFRVAEGDEAARRWLEGILANEPRVYSNNTSSIEAVGAGEVDVAFVNHYYLHRFKSEDPNFPAANYYLKDGDVGAMINIAGAGILKEASNLSAAERFLDYMLSEDAQTYFAEETTEYPLIEGVGTWDELVPLDEIETPGIDLSDLWDLQKTLELLHDVGAL